MFDGCRLNNDLRLTSCVAQPPPMTRGHLRNHGGICGKPAMTAARCSSALRPRINALETSTMPRNVSGPSVQLQAGKGAGARGRVRPPA